jgi:hypothetical protein
MPSSTRRRVRRRAAQDTLADITNHPRHVLLVHYSCESFYDREDPGSPRITSIAVRFFDTGQTLSWSIHQVAEVKGALGSIEARYDELEREMLTGFYRFVADHLQATWVHWNMRDVNYGFEALSHRLRVLGGQAADIPDQNKVDLARLLVDLYGVRYIGHPRLERLVEKNEITKLGFLSGKEEASAFDHKDYVKLHQSTLRKVDIIGGLVERATDRTLKTNARWHEIYGLDIAGIYQGLTEHPLWRIGSLVALPLSLVLGAFTVARYLFGW